MKNWMGVWALVPVVALAQAAFPTEFPAGATALEPVVLQQKLIGQVVHSVYASGAQVRVEYKADYAYLNTGNFSDSGKWRVDGSQVCIDWAKLSKACFEVRGVGEALYAKRATNGEIVLMNLQ